MIAAVHRGLRGHLAEPLHRTAWSLMASTLLTSLLGVGFWAVATHIYSAAEVGRDSALIASMITLSSVCQLNLNNVVVRFLPQVREHLGRRVLDAYAAALTVSLIGGSAFVVIAPLTSDGFSFLRDQRLLAVAYAVAVGLWSIFALQDAMLTALGRAWWLPIENALFSAAKIAMLPAALVLVGDHGIFVAWVIPALLTLPVVNWLLARRVVPDATESQRNAPGVLEVFGRRRLVAFLAQDYVGSVLGQIVMTAIPLLVVGLLGSEANAYFYMPFMLVSSLDLMFLAVTTSLTTEGARSQQRARHLTRMVVRRFLAIHVPLALLIVAAAPLLLLPFGHDYAEHGAGVLRLLAAASCCRAVLFLFGAVARLHGHGTRLLLLQAANAALLVGLITLLGSRHGLDGVGLAWLVTHGTLAAVVVPSLVRFLRHPEAGIHVARQGATGTSQATRQPPRDAGAPGVAARARLGA